jgi:DNA-binding CsgD family transcriptional regulator
MAHSPTRCCHPTTRSELRTTRGDPPRERLSNNAIAARLHITERTVESHITKAFQQLGLTDDPSSHRRVLAVLAYLRHQGTTPS